MSNVSQSNTSNDTTFFLCSLEGRQLTVSYAEPKNTEVQAQQQQQLLRQSSNPASKAVYVGNLPPGVTDRKLKEVFTAWGEVSEQLLDSGIASLLTSRADTQQIQSLGAGVKGGYSGSH